MPGEELFAEGAGGAAGEGSDAIDGFAKGLDGMGDVARQALADIVPRIQQDLRQKYAAESDPYGTPWAQHLRAAPWPVLDKTGNLKGSLTVEISQDDELVITYHNPIGGYHQDGTRVLPKRMLVPTQELPEQWVQWYQEALEKRMAEMLEQIAVELA